MAIKEDMEFPKLTPPDDRVPSGRSLFRRPEELTDDQFDLLAAAWADDALSGESMAEMEYVLSAVPARKERAESFRKLRLTQGIEKWPGMQRALKSSPAGTALRRSILPTLLAAAAILIFILSGPAGAKLKILNSPDHTTGSPVMTVADIPGSLPIIRNDNQVTISRETAAIIADGNNNLRDDNNFSADNAIAGGPLISASLVIPGDQALTSDMQENFVDRTIQLITINKNAAILAIAPASDRNLATIGMVQITPQTTVKEEKNWMFRSISLLASAVTGKEKQIDGYTIANGCINGLNTILGWEMELEKVSNRAGEPVSVNFSSSLLSFTKPVNKITP